jgi:simple sugar transport system permease protein
MRNRFKGPFRGGSHERYLFLVVLFFIAVLTALTGGRFLRAENLIDLLVSNVPLGIMSTGVLVVIISGDIDISFMAVATVAQYLMGLFMLKVGGNLGLAFVIPMAAGAFLGLINALFVHYLKVPAIITTIATMNVYYGILMWLSKGTWLYGFPSWFSTDDLGKSVFPLGVLLGVFFLTYIILQYLPVGRKVFAMGDNREAARRAGIGILAVHVFIYMYMGAVAALGAVIQTTLIQNIAPNSLVGREMEAIAIVVLGGASLTGGKGTVHGTLLGLILISIIGNGLTLVGISSYWYRFFMGMVVLLSFCVSTLRRKERIRGLREYKDA